MEADRGDRIDFVDGLRGIAVLSVLVYHAWLDPWNAGYPIHHIPLGVAAILSEGGYEGVSLFLVLSGFCLSYPLWRARLQGRPRWFVPSQFFARRCLRILPPYYAALVIATLLNTVYGQRLQGIVLSFRWPITLDNVMAHLLLVHNATPYANAIDGPFWSLGLEWQWYWVFPLVVLLAARSPRVTLAAAVTALLLYHWGLHDLAGTWEQRMLPQRLFEFVAGVLVARFVASGRTANPRLLVGIVVVAMFALQLCRLHATFLQQFANGTGFGALILLGYSSHLTRAALSWRPLAALGLISYSVYLVHEPVMQAAQYAAWPLLPDASWLLVYGVACGILASLPFYWLVERRCLDQAARDRWIPYLAPLFRWADRIAPDAGQRPTPVPLPALRPHEDHPLEAMVEVR